MVVYIFSECPNLAHKVYKKTGHDNVAKVIHWKLSEEWGLKRAEKWYINKPGKIRESEECKILRNFQIQTDNEP